MIGAVRPYEGAGVAVDDFGRLARALAPSVPLDWERTIGPPGAKEAVVEAARRMRDSRDRWAELHKRVLKEVQGGEEGRLG
jgi:hypothetical protein